MPTVARRMRRGGLRESYQELFPGRPGGGRRYASHPQHSLQYLPEEQANRVREGHLTGVRGWSFNQGE